MSAPHDKRPARPPPADADAETVTTTFTRSRAAVTVVAVDDKTGMKHVSGLEVTSVSTTPVEGEDTLLMFGVDYDAVTASERLFGGGEEWNEEPFTDDPAVEEAREAEFGGEGWSRPWYVVEWLNYISSAQKGGTMLIQARKLDGTDDHYAIHQTRIPAYRFAIRGTTHEEDFDFHDIVYDVSDGAGELRYGVDRDDSWDELDMGIVYKDPFVLYVEALAGWVMILSRYRMEWTGDSPIPAASPESSLGDLVMYWSASQDFREEDVRGPFRLVGCTDCVLNDSTGEVVEGVRCWIGTAGAAVVKEASEDEFLYVYYVVENSTAFLSAVDRRDKAVRMADGTRVDRYDADGDGHFTDADIDLAVAEVAASIVEANEIVAGTWLRKISMADLAAVIEDEGSYNVEEAWDDLPNATPIVPGTVMGRVRIWAVPDYDSAGDIQEKFVATTVSEDDALDGITYSVFWADPAPVFDGTTLALFVAGIMPAGVPTTSDDEGLLELIPYLAVWSCVAVDESDAEDRYGLDFTVRVPSTVRPDDGSTHDDRIAGGGSSTRLYLDPDPVGEIDGVGWCVYVGVDEGGGTTGVLSLYVASDPAQVFRRWNSP